LAKNGYALPYTSSHYIIFPREEILSDPNPTTILQEIQGLKETLKQIAYQNEMMLRWVNGAVITVDREGKVLHANEVALSTLGWQSDEFTGCQVHETIHHSQDDGSEYPWDFCPVFAAIEDGSSHHVDGDVFWKKNGSSFSADYIVCPTRNDQNEITGAILTFRNLTEQRIQESKRIHRMKLMAIGELSAGIAHEINTPVQFIGSNISFMGESFQDLLKVLKAYRKLGEIVQKEPYCHALLQEIAEIEESADIDYLEEEIPKAFEQTLHGVKQVTDLVQGLKGFAHSGTEGEKVASDINNIINNALLVSRNVYKYVADLETNLGDIPPVKVYPGDIGQVVINLVINASHSIEEKKGKSTSLGKITINSLLEGNDIVIQVSDTGKGIPEGVRDRIFDPFFTTKEVGRGSGQGLAISHTIINEKHNGEISFNSVIGEGTTFTVRIPIQKK
jgi:PAS domain S-box-containing protein